MDPSLLGVMQNMVVTVRQFEISSEVYSTFRGNADCGGDSSAVRDQLRGVQQIQASFRAFAAILEDGSVVTWGDANYGGDSLAVRDQLRGVQHIQASLRALLRFWKMDPSLPGVMHTVAVTVRQFEISSEVCSRFKPLLEPLLRFWKMDPSLLGVMQTMVVTVWQFEISSEVCSTFKPLWEPCCDSGRWIRRYLGWRWLWRWHSVTVRQFEISWGVCSLVVPAEWQGLSCHIWIILVGAPLLGLVGGWKA